jgi:hypothetical protein
LGARWAVAAFREGLKGTGYVEGQNVRVSLGQRPVRPGAGDGA